MDTAASMHLITRRCARLTLVQPWVTLQPCAGAELISVKVVKPGERCKITTDIYQCYNRDQN
eukprot:3940753-Rhodomonas_salina.2